MSAERSSRPADPRQRVTAALTELERVARELLLKEQSVAPEVQLDAVELPVLLSFHGVDSRLANEFRSAEADKLIELLRARIRDALLNAVAFERGHVYCLRCESSRCGHSLPPHARAVFAGYEETGRPDWVELDKLLHRRKDSRIERLYGAHGAGGAQGSGSRELVAVPLHRDEVYGRLLPGFDEARWRCYILGQLCLGYFVPRGERSLMALTVQLVRIEKGTDGPLLGINLVGKPPDATSSAPLEESILAPLPDALRQLRREIAVFTGRGGTRVPGIGVALERLTNRCHALLRDAGRDLEHRRRTDDRRTDHARERSRQGNRPTHKAFEDARAATDDQLGWDTQEGTIVVLGPSSRVHFFADHGKHVSSVAYSGHVVTQRTSQGRWVALDPEKRDAFRRALITSAAESPKPSPSPAPRTTKAP